MPSRRAQAHPTTCPRCHKTFASTEAWRAHANRQCGDPDNGPQRPLTRQELQARKSALCPHPGCGRVVGQHLARSRHVKNCIYAPAPARGPWRAAPSEAPADTDSSDTDWRPESPTAVQAPAPAPASAALAAPAPGGLLAALGLQLPHPAAAHDAPAAAPAPAAVPVQAPAAAHAPIPAPLPAAAAPGADGVVAALANPAAAALLPPAAAAAAAAELQAAFALPPPLAELISKHRTRAQVAEELKLRFGDLAAGELAKVNNAADDNNSAAFNPALTRLLHLAKDVLPAGRSGRSGTRWLRARMAAADRRIAGGPELQPVQGPAAGGANQDRTEEARLRRATRRRVVRKVKAGRLRQAATAVQPAERAPDGAATMAALKALHPTEDLTLLPPANPAHDAAPFQLANAEDLDRIIKKLPRDSAPGPSGWKYEHVQAAWSASAPFRTEFHRFVNKMLAGALPRHPLLLAARLTPLSKGEGKVRPIAVPEVFVRIAGAAAAHAAAPLASALHPLQVGVNVAGGVEVYAHAVRSRLRQFPLHAAATLDSRNAFNALHRRSIATALTTGNTATLAPLLPMFKWAYGAPTDLAVSQADGPHLLLRSSRGCRQGDPLGPLLFAAGTHKILLDVYKEFKNRDVFLVAFLDDVTMCGPPAALADAVAMFKARAADIGLELQPAKSGVYSHDAAVAQHASALTGLPLHADGMKVVGSAIGTDSFIEDHCNNVVDKALEWHESLIALEAPLQTTLLLMRKSGAARVPHLARSTEPEATAGPLKRFSEATASMVGGLIQGPGGNLTEWHRQLISLPTRLGGLGMTRWTEQSASNAYLAGQTAAHKFLAGHDGTADTLPLDGPDGPLASTDPKWSGRWKRMQQTARGAAAPGDGPLDGTAHPADHPLYKRLQGVATRAGAEVLHSSLLKRAPAGRLRGVPADRSIPRAILRSTSSAASSAFLDATGSTPASRMTDYEMRTALALRLCIPIWRGREPPDASCSRGGAVGPRPCRRLGIPVELHALHCRAVGSRNAVRHDIVCIDALRPFAREAGYATAAEPMLAPLIEAAPAGNAEAAASGVGDARGDLLLIPSATAGDAKMLVADIMVTNPVAPSYRDNAANNAGATAKRGETVKRGRAHYKKLVSAGVKFAPFVIEAFGRWGAAAEKLLDDMAAHGKATRPGFDVRTFKTRCKLRVSVAVQRCNAMAVARATQRAAAPAGLLIRAGRVGGANWGRR